MLRILIALWWTAVVLSTAMVLSLAALLVVWVTGRIRRGRRSDGTRADAYRGDAGRAARWLDRPLVRRIVLPAWAVTFATWIVLECLGAAFLLWNAAFYLSDLPDLPADLPASPPGTVSVVAIGGSTTLGAPYHARLSFAHVVGWRLAAAFPDHRVLVDNLAYGGANLEDKYRALHRLERRPDVLLVYAGHNEFLRYPPDREAGTPYYGRAYFSLLAHALAAQIERRGAHEGPAWHGRRRLLDRPVCTAHEAAEVHRRFRATLEAILGAWKGETPPLAIVFLPGANESGFEPNRSVLADDAPAHTRARLQRIHDRLEQPGLSPATERRLLATARALAPELAWTWFRLGRWYEATGQTERARRHYQRAIDRDGFPIRATSRIRSIVRAASRASGAVLLDARSALAAFSANGIPGNDVIHDNCHPNLAVHVELANMVLRVLRERQVPQAWPAPESAREPFEATVAATRAHFGLDRAAWVEICEDEARFHEYLAAYAYDTRARGARRDAYRAAADRVRRGVLPPDAAIPAMESPTYW
jgi:hypothetical protein